MVTRPISLPVFRARFENVRVQNKFFDTITAISTNHGIITLSKARIRLENIYITIRISKEVKHKNKWNNFNLFRFRGFPNFSESKLEKLSERQSFRIFRICPNWKRPGDNLLNICFNSEVMPLHIGMREFGKDVYFSIYNDETGMKVIKCCSSPNSHVLELIGVVSLLLLSSSCSFLRGPK